MFPTVCKVCPLSQPDKSHCGRPRHTGVWSSARDEECFCGVLGEGRHNHFSVRHENISLRLALGVSGITLDSWHYLQPVSALIAGASQELAGLWLFVQRRVVRHVSFIWAIVSDSISGMSWHCAAWVRVTDDGASLLPPASLNCKHPLKAAAARTSLVNQSLR